MKIIYTILCLLISAISFAQKISLEEVKLKWKDFTIKEGFRNHPFSAKIITSIPYNFKVYEKGKVVHFIVESELSIDHNKSWIKKEFYDKSTDREKLELLNHEKGHLIIALIYHKKIQIALSTHHFLKKPKHEVDSIFSQYMAACDADNLKYDDETNHAKNTEEQKEWMDKLLNEINSLYGNDKEIQYAFKQDLIMD